MDNQSVERIRFSDLPADKALSAMLLIVQKGRPKAWLGDSPSAQDLHELLDLEEVRTATVLWRDEAGKIMAFGALDPFNNLLFECAEDRFFNMLFLEAAELTAGKLKEKNSGENEIPTLDGSSRSEDKRRVVCFEKAGFRREALESIFFKQKLDASIFTSRLPDGFCIRPMGGMDELNDYIALHRAAFGTKQMTRKFREAIMSAPGYQASLDLVAAAPDDRLAGFCMGQFTPGEDEGWTDPIGVHPDFRGMGLAKALIQDCMAKLKARGLAYAKLGTSSDNKPMISLALAAGFKETERKMWFTKVISDKNESG